MKSRSSLTKCGKCDNLERKKVKESPSGTGYKNPRIPRCHGADVQMLVNRKQRLIRPYPERRRK